MSTVNGINQSTPVSKVAAPAVQRTIATDAPKPLPAVDRVELSGVGHILKSLQSNDIRADKVADIKAQIAAGTYGEDDKIDASLDKLLDDVLKD